jgi:3-deoxy-D-manno-octulosonic acid kinase
MNICTAPVASGEIIYDASRWSPDGVAKAFDGVIAASVERRGRGDVRFLQLPFAEAVLRQYQRGGWAARVSRDWYFWLGREASRPFREFRLTAHLFELGLPVPRPLAARFLRSGIGYRAALITERIVQTRTLAECLQAGVAIDWSAAGQMIGRFHAHGLWHADLNAHNLLVDAAGVWWLIDLDRGRMRAAPGAWQQGNLARLRRSLLKLGAVERIEGFNRSAWPALCQGYRAQ